MGNCVDVVKRLSGVYSKSHREGPDIRTKATKLKATKLKAGATAFCDCAFRDCAFRDCAASTVPGRF